MLPGQGAKALQQVWIKGEVCVVDAAPRMTSDRCAGWKGIDPWPGLPGREARPDGHAFGLPYPSADDCRLDEVPAGLEQEIGSKTGPAVHVRPGAFKAYGQRRAMQLYSAGVQ